MNTQTVGELIRQQRLLLGKPIREVAAQIELDQSILSKVERNKMQLPERVIAKLAHVLKIDYEELQKKFWSEKIYYQIKNADYGREALGMALKRLEKEQKGSTKDLFRAEITEKVISYFEGQPVEKVWIFGSFARGEESRDSDLDLLVKFKRPHKIDLFDYIGIKQDLEDITGRQVDLVEEGQVLERIKPIIEKEKKLLYESQAI